MVKDNLKQIKTIKTFLFKQEETIIKEETKINYSSLPLFLNNYYTRIEIATDTDTNATNFFPFCDLQKIIIFSSRIATRSLCKWKANLIKHDTVRNIFFQCFQVKMAGNKKHFDQALVLPWKL